MQSNHRNNFDFLRFAAAVSVWYGHCFALTGIAEPLSPYISFESFGSLGVTVFFIISGYFVTMSYDSKNNLLAYTKNRALRILPALFAVVLFTVFILGPAITSVSLHAYFTSSVTWRYLRCLLIFPLQYDLPGVFTDNVVSGVNGSLWTLQHEVRLYAAIAFLGVLGILRPRLMFALLTGLICIRIYGIVFTPDAKAHVLTIRWGKLDLAVKLASQFAAGAFLYLVRDKLKLRKEFFAVAALIIIASIIWQTAASNILFDLAFSYAVIYLGFLKLPLLHGFSKWGDFSYGMYLYAFPVQQLLVHLSGRHADFQLFMIASFSCTLFCAVMSWHFVESPALKLKK